MLSNNDFAQIIKKMKNIYLQYNMCEHYKKYILNEEYNFCPECGKEIILDIKDKLKRKFIGSAIFFRHDNSDNYIFDQIFSTKIKELEENKEFIQNNETYIVEIIELEEHYDNDINTYKYIAKKIEVTTKDEYVEKINKKYLKYFSTWCEKTYMLNDNDIRIKNKLYFIFSKTLYIKSRQSNDYIDIIMIDSINFVHGMPKIEFNLIMKLGSLGPIKKTDVIDMLIEYNELEIE